MNLPCNIKHILVAGFLCLFPLALSAAEENVQLQLKWLHQFQFAGFYMALQKGYYHDEGLNVKIIEGGPGRKPVDFVISTPSSFAVSNTGALLAHAQGKRIHAIAAIFQHSPLALMVRKSSGITTVADLKHQRIMLQANHAAEITALLHQFNVNTSNFTLQPTSYNLNDLIEGRTDAFSIYTSNQPQQLKAKGIPYRIFNPVDYGIDFYGDILITSSHELKDHPDRVEAMLRASLKGWSYALEHIEETIDLIHTHYNSQNLSRQQLVFEATEIKKMIKVNLVEIGFMNKARWQRIANTYAELGMLPKNYDFSDFIYQKDSSLAGFFQRNLWKIISFFILIFVITLALHSLSVRRALKKRTAELQLHKTRLSDIIEISHEWIWEVDTKGRYTYSSHMVKEILGYSSEEILPTYFFDHFEPTESTTLTAAVFASFATQQAFTHFINTNLHKDGHQIVLLTNAIPLFDNNNTLIGYRGSNRDITSQYRAEELTRKTSLILEMIASGQPDLEIYHTIILIFEARNPGMKASISRLKDNKLLHCSSPSLPKAFSDAIDGVTIGPSVTSCGTAAFHKKRTVVKNISNDPLWASFKHIALQYGLKACWSEPILNAKNDVLGTYAMYYHTLRKPTNSELYDISTAAWLVGIVIENAQKKASLSKLSQAISQAGDAVMITDLNGTIEYVNEEFTHVTGYSQADVMGKSPNILNAQRHPDKFFKAMWQAISKDGNWTGTVWNKRKNNERYPASLRIRRLAVDAQTPSHYIATFSDITHKLAMEEAIRNTQKMEALGTLVGGVAHNFNNILAGIVGKSYLIQQKATDEKSILHLKDIDRLCQRTAQMIQHLLIFARKGRMEMADIALIPLLKESIQTARLGISENITLHQELSNEQLYIHGDASQLEQVIINLINNASHALTDRPNKEISISARRCKPSHCSVGTTCKNQGHGIACLMIKDTGSGITSDDLEHIFEPFFTTKEVGVGTGLGLSMTHGTIESHNGSIEVETEISKGSTFKIFLPLLDFTSWHKTDDLKCIPSESNKCILLVDDDHEVRETTATILRNIGYQVMTACNGQEAVTLFKKQPEFIDLLLIDYAMPIMNGPEAIHLMRQIKPQLPVLLSTGYDKGDINIKGETHTLVISKPISIPKLSQHIINLINKTNNAPACKQ